MFDINGRAVIDPLKKHSSASLKGKKRPQKRPSSEISDDPTEEQGNPNKKSRLDNSKPNEESINQTKEEIEEKHDAKVSDKRQGSQESEVKHGAKGTIEIRDIKQRSGTRKNQQNSGKAAIDLDNVEEREDPYLDTYWFEELGLKVRDKYIIQGGYWINDRIIDAASRLMRKMNSEVNGLNRLAYAERYGHVLTTESEQFIQIINVRKTHWISLSNLQSNMGEVFIYDSLINLNVKRDKISFPIRVEQTTCQLLRTNLDFIDMRVVDVQQQRG